MSNQTVVSAKITLKPEAVEIIRCLLALWYSDLNDEDQNRWAKVGEKYPIVAKYGANDRADFIPYGGYGDLVNENTLVDNQWNFVCSTGNKEDEVEAFMKMLPLIADAAKVTTEVEGYTGGFTVEYKLSGEDMMETNRYREYEPEPYGMGWER
jgi:hypothetical protein